MVLFSLRRSVPKQLIHSKSGIACPGSSCKCKLLIEGSFLSHACRHYNTPEQLRISLCRAQICLQQGAPYDLSWAWSARACSGCYGLHLIGSYTHMRRQLPHVRSYNPRYYLTKQMVLLWTCLLPTFKYQQLQSLCVIAVQSGRFTSWSQSSTIRAKSTCLC